MMSVVLVLVTLLVVLALLVLRGRSMGWLHIDVPLDRIFPDHVEPGMLHGTDGARVIAYHAPSGFLIQVVKSFTPEPGVPFLYARVDPVGKVRMRVMKMVTSSQRLGDVRARCPGRRRCFLPYWQLPSPEEAEKAEETDCGASLSKVKAALHRLLSGEPAFAGHPLFYVWSEKFGAHWIVGTFEEREVKEE